MLAYFHKSILRQVLELPELIPHIIYLLNCAEKFNIDINYVEKIYATLAEHLYNTGKFVSASEIYEKLLKLQLKIYGNENTKQTAEIYLRYTQSTYKSGYFVKTDELVKKSISLCKVCGMGKKYYNNIKNVEALIAYRKEDYPTSISILEEILLSYENPEISDVYTYRL